MVEQYATQLRMLLPPGPAWDGSDAERLISGCALPFARFHARVDVLRAESDPRLTVELLPDWERQFGLPDACSLGTQTQEERRQALVAKVTDLGGCRVPRYLQLAAALGYSGASVQRYRYHSCELSCEEPVAEIDWRFVWSLNIQSSTRVVDSTCESGADEPLRTWGDAVLSCVIQRETPAQSVVFIKYKEA